VSRGLAEGLQYKEIALRRGRDPSVISREVARHGGRAAYRAAAADEAAPVSGPRCSRTSRSLVPVPLTGRDSLTVGGAIIAATGGPPAQIRFRNQRPTT
jgi:hypothetical protein